MILFRNNKMAASVKNHYSWHFSFISAQTDCRHFSNKSISDLSLLRNRLFLWDVFADVTYPNVPRYNVCFSLFQALDTIVSSLFCLSWMIVDDMLSIVKSTVKVGQTTCRGVNKIYRLANTKFLFMFI